MSVALSSLISGWQAKHTYMQRTAQAQPHGITTPTHLCRDGDGCCLLAPCHACAQRPRHCFLRRPLCMSWHMPHYTAPTVAIACLPLLPLINTYAAQPLTSAPLPTLTAAATHTRCYPT